MDLFDFSSYSNNPQWNGFGVYLTILLGFLNIYTFIFNETQREKQKTYLLKKIELLSKVPFNKIGTLSAKIFIKYSEFLFGKPTQYTLNDPVFWNIRSNLFFIGVILIILLYTIFKLKGNYTDYYPIFIFLLPYINYCILSDRIKILKYNSQILYKKSLLEKHPSKEKLKKELKKLLKEKQNYLHLKKNYTFCLLRISLNYTLVFLILYYILKIFNLNALSLYATSMLIFDYSLFYMLSIFFFTLGRIFIYKISLSTSFFITLKTIFFSLVLILISLGIAYILVQSILFHTLISFSNENSRATLQYLDILLFIILLLPLGFYMSIIFLEIVGKFLFKPLHLIIHLLYYLIRFNLHLILLAVLLIYLLNNLYFA